MPGPLSKYPIELTPEQERHLQQLSGSYTASFAEVQRARLLLLAHQHPPCGTSRSPGRWAAVSRRSSAGGGAGT
jgi:hypothetical protein